MKRMGYFWGNGPILPNFGPTRGEIGPIEGPEFWGLGCLAFEMIIATRLSGGLFLIAATKESRSNNLPIPRGSKSALKTFGLQGF